MSKKTFMFAIKAPLREFGYAKYGNYWYKTCGDILRCIYVQGSQWDKDNYYVELGVSKADSSNLKPTVLHWIFRHRCIGKSGNEINILPQELFQCMDDTFSDVTSVAQIPQYLAKRNAVKVVNQYWF